MTRAKASADAAREEREALEREIESMRRALLEKESALEREAERERVLREEEESARGGLTTESGVRRREGGPPRRPTRAPSAALVAAEAAFAEAARLAKDRRRRTPSPRQRRVPSDSRRTARPERKLLKTGAGGRSAAPADAKRTRDALDVVDAAKRRLQAATAEERELETAVEKASRRAVTAALERRVGKDVYDVAGATTSRPSSSSGSGGGRKRAESLRKTAAVRRAECERLVTEAESEEEAKRARRFVDEGFQRSRGAIEGGE